MARIADRNPESYTIGVPQVMFSPLPENGDLKYFVDFKALIDAYIGNTNMAGHVLNSYGNAVGTPDSIREACYLGALDSSSLGGDVTELEHTVCNLGYEEVDRSIVIDRPIEYTLTFDEPDQKNMDRFIISSEAELGLSLRPLRAEAATLGGKTFAATKSDVVVVVSHTIGNPEEAEDTIRSLWMSGNPSSLNPPNGFYGFIIGGDNTVDLEGEWVNRRHWIAYREFTFDGTAVGSDAWSYIQPQGSMYVPDEGSGPAYPTFHINNTVISLPDSKPCVVTCADVDEWNAVAPLAWTGYGWVGADEGFYGLSIVATSKAFKRVVGAALVVTLTTIGVSVLHIIPRASLFPEGTLTFNSDSWMNGQFKLIIQRDAKARLFDRSPAQAVPFGVVQTLRLPSADE